MKLVDRGLNEQAEALEEAQTKIRLAVRDGWLARRTKADINAAVQKIIAVALKEVKLPVLRSAAYRSLNAFAERQYMTYIRRFGMSSEFVLLLATLIDDTAKPIQLAQATEKLTRSPPPNFQPPLAGTSEAAVPLQIYSKEYFERYVVPVFDEIAAQKALDPDDISGSNSLRNRAEMEVRYAHHLNEIERLRAAGVKLVTSSMHADCSERCYPWQGRVYSLDGTSGTTEDGKSYVPIETATDVYYTTKAGKTYKNGLFGFNCRHYVMEYRSRMIIPHVSEQEQRREYAINRRQRELERRVREYREKALIFRKIDRERYLAARKRAIAANKEYIQFSKDNGRAYYPSRTTLL